MYKQYKKANDKVMKYFKSHPTYNSLVHLAAGMGLGIVLARPFIFQPLKVGVALVMISLLAHFYPLVAEK